MVGESRSEPLYVVHYTHNEQEIDMAGRGETGEIAFQRYLAELRNQGVQDGEYQYVSSARLETPDDCDCDEGP